MSEHTPTPYTEWNGSIYANVTRTDRYGISGDKIADCSSDDLGEDESEGEEIAEANAAFLCLAANMHQILVDALQAAFDEFGTKGCAVTRQMIEALKFAGELPQ